MVSRLNLWLVVFLCWQKVLRQAGALHNRWYLPSAQSIYFMGSGSVVQQGEPLCQGVYEIPPFNRVLLIQAIRNDQQGRSSFPEFLNAAWESGVISYDVDFIERTVTYYGVNGDSYVESYPFVSV